MFPGSERVSMTLLFGNRWIISVKTSCDKHFHYHGYPHHTDLAERMMTRASRSFASSSRAVRLVSWLKSSTFSAWTTPAKGDRYHRRTLRNTAEQNTTGHIIGQASLAPNQQDPPSHPHPSHDHAPSHPRYHGRRGQSQKVLKSC